MVRPRRSPLERFHEKYVVNNVTGCWEWTGYVAPSGYGNHYGEPTGRGYSEAVLAHRFAFEALVGPIPKGMQIDHLCRVRRCVNPEHLEVVTPLVNTQRGNSPSQVAIRTGVCSRGHSEWKTSKRGRRYCAPCRRESDRLSKRRQRMMKKKMTMSGGS